MKAEAVVVGAGHAGLVASRYLSSAGLSVTVLDAGRVAQSWRERYDGLRLITTRRQSQLPGLDYPSTVARWPSRDELVTYLEDYADAFDLDVREQTRVESITCRDDDFTIRTADGIVHTEHLVLATGRHHRPVEPSGMRAAMPKGTRVLHSAEVRTVADLAPGEQLVIGGGASGTDLARMLADRGDRVVHYCRTVPMVLPETVLGVPTATVVGKLVTLLPGAGLDGLARVLAPLLGPHGRRAAGAGPSQPSEILARGRLPGLDRGYGSHVGSGRIRLVSELVTSNRSCEGRSYADAEWIRFEPSNAILATGFSTDLSFLDPRIAATVVGCAADRPHGLHALGYSLASQGQFRQAITESSRIVSHITGRNRQ